MWATGEQIFSHEDTMTFICFIIVFILLEKGLKSVEKQSNGFTFLTLKSFL